jgi:hypothetical protein
VLEYRVTRVFGFKWIKVTGDAENYITIFTVSIFTKYYQNEMRNERET